MVRKRNSKSASLFILALGAVVALVLTCCRSAASEAAYPIERGWRFVQRQIGARIVGAFRGAAAAAENEALRREVEALSLLRADCARIEEENSHLRKVLGYRERLGTNWLAAEVLTRGGGAASTKATIKIARGADDGIKSGAVVVAGDGLVGRVGEVTAKTAEVVLIQDSSTRVACEINAGGAGGRCRGILTGGDGERLIVEHILNARRGRLPAGAKVYTSGLGGVFPAGIAVGSLMEVLSDEGGPALAVAIKPTVDFDHLKDVFIRCEK